VGVHNGGPGFQKGGNDLEGFNQRYMEHVHGFWRGLQRPLTDLINRYHVQRLVVAGNKSLIPEYIKILPRELSDCIVAHVAMDSFTTPAEAVTRIWPEIEKWERQRETTVVRQLLDAAAVSQRAAVGIEASLKFIQEGRAAKLLVTKDFDREVLQCAKCSYVAPGTSSACPHCSASDVEKGVLSTILPRLVARSRIPVEVVKGEASDLLKASGGIGVFLRF
jgi:peptide subunit release factor 1 (eRF1)